jgi:hypothetical protein
MYRWKVLMCDPYYCGVVKLADWPEVKKDGLHKPMITPEEHDILVAIAKNKGKRFIVDRNNPEFLLSNEAECAECVLANKPYPRLVGYWQNNGQKKNFKRYRRYRCRTCNLGVRQEAFHSGITEELTRLLLSDEQREKLKTHMRKVWSNYEVERMERARIAFGRVQILKDKKNVAMDSYLAEQDLEMKREIKDKIETLKSEIAEAEKAATEAQNFEKDFDEFIIYAFDIMDNLGTKWWQQDKATMRVYKQMLFPAGIQLSPDKKVYIPEISPIYRYGSNEKAPEGAEFTRLEGCM